MTTADEIERRVEQVDTARSAKRAAAAQQVGALAQRRAAIAEQLADIEEQLGDVLAAVSDVMDIDELAGFTDVPAADLTRWLNSPETHPHQAQTARRRRGQRHEPRTVHGQDADGPRDICTARARAASDAADAPVRVPAEVA